jgi:hypothetical protein
MKLAYCDAIAHYLQKALLNISVEDTQKYKYIKGMVGGVMYDLHPEEGYFLSTKKTIDCTDVNGKAYRITVEELN